jgi:hypothetical protein
MKKLLPFIFIALLAFSATLFVSSAANAQGGLPPDQPRKGLIYAGLEPSNDAACPRGFKVKINGKADPKHCSHGPDTPLAGQAVASSVPPVTTPVPQSAYICDGDGTTGKRVQLLYVHASDVLDRYSSYLTSFQSWANGVDSIFNNSAAETGGTRHVRYVHDSNCLPTVIDVQVSTAGDDNFANTESELLSNGYNRSDRKYVVFVDAAVYCGIGDIVGDDSPGATNLSNSSVSFARIDNGCWSAAIPAHELMHGLGGVQISAPHSSGGWHCVDTYDRMCYSDSPYYPTMQNLCPNTAEALIFDCNHDDYFSTNPPAGSYLATHWNTANNVYLIGAPGSSSGTTQALLVANSNLTGTTGRRGFTPTDTFTGKATVTVAIHVVDSNNANVSGATVNFTVLRPNGTAQCSLSAVTNSNGTAMASCSLSNNSPTGTWDAHVVSINKASYSMSSGSMATDHSFTHN